MIVVLATQVGSRSPPREASVNCFHRYIASCHSMATTTPYGSLVEFLHLHAGFPGDVLLDSLDLAITDLCATSRRQGGGLHRPGEATPGVFSRKANLSVCCGSETRRRELFTRQVTKKYFIYEDARTLWVLPGGRGDGDTKGTPKMPYLVANCAPRCLWGGRRRENIARMIDTLEGLCSICLEPIMPSDPVVSVNSAEIHRRCYTGEGPKLVPNPPAKRKPNSN